MVENHLRWFGHVNSSESDEQVRIVDLLMWSLYKRGRKRPKRTLNKIIHRDLFINDLSSNITIDPTK